MIKQDGETGLWSVSYSKRNPKTRVPISLRRKGIKTQAEAKRIFNQLVVKVEERIKSKVVPTWANMVERYLQEAPLALGLTLKTVSGYESYLQMTLKDWGERFVDTITAQEIRQLVKDVLGHRSEQHQKGLLKCIRQVFEYSMEAGVVLFNPTPRMKFKESEKIKKVLTEVQASMLLNRSKVEQSTWYPIWAMAIYTGMRSGELYALKWDRVDLENRIIKVDSSWNSKDGYKSTKTGDERIVEIAPPLVEVLKYLRLKNDGSQFVLPHLYEWTDGKQAGVLRTFLSGVGLPQVKFHDLRATWATMMLGRGIEPIKVMKMGGWRNLKTMMIYARASGIDIRGITDDLNLHNPSENEAQILKLATV